MMTEFWLISVPGNPEPDNSWDEIADRTHHLSSTTKFTIPELKVRVLQDLIHWPLSWPCWVQAAPE